jgi:hypothetical protein
MAANALTPDQRKVLAFINERGAASHAQLCAQFRAHANSIGYGAGKWLGPKLDVLEQRGHIEFSVSTGTWAIAPGVVLAALAVQDHAGCSVAQPRRINMLAGGVYKPMPVAMRPGAMDYAAVPSLHMGQRRAFRRDGGTTA